MHAVPMAAGYTAGSVEEVNRFGVMVGRLTGTGKPSLAFRYFPGLKAVTVLPGGEQHCVHQQLTGN
ncbi:hypothetical protein [Streptomyces sp. NPDC060031]|uniref:hypothetical protein n=1 Tax=Streptomyces sp. NPDC060031 TaxID=3347043 RepID=UPI00367A2D61